MPYKFEYQKENKIKKLSQIDHEALAVSIAKKWDRLDDLRRPNLEAIEAIEKVIYPSKKSKSGKINIDMPEIYEVKETYKAHLWKSWYSSLDNMFDVQGKSREDQIRAAHQKAALIDAFRDIEFVSKLEKGLDNWINKGEFIAFVNWNTKVKQIRRKELYPVTDETAQNNENFANNPPFDNNGNSRNPAAEDGAFLSGFDSFMGDMVQMVPAYTVKDELVYDGPDLAIVSPESFVFDPDKKENFDACPKIYRSWATYDEISSNKLYENFEELKDLCDEKENTASTSKSTKGDQIELLEYWGDIKLKDGTLLKNRVITLAGRKNIIRFEENPFIMNPFVFAAFLEDPETKRGISPLYIALPLNEISTTILNLQLDALKLIVNKPYLAPKGSLSGKISITEGAIIEYDPALMPEAPIPLEFKDALVGWDFLKFFESKIESTTGMFKYMTGNPKGTAVKTATEASGLMMGQNVRLSKEIDVLNFKVKIPIIQKIAELMANFSCDLKEIKIYKPNGDIDFALIDESTRQGKYEYIIGDASAIFEKKTKLAEYLGILKDFASQPDVASRIKWIEVLKWTFEQLGVADPNMFIKNDMPEKGIKNGLKPSSEITGL